MSSDANDRGVVELSATSSVVPPSMPQDSSGKPVEDPPTRSKTRSSTVWSYAKQPWSSKGFSRVFSKVFGPSKEAEKALPEPTADTALSPSSATHPPPEMAAPRSDPVPPRKDPRSIKVVDCSDVDLSVENQDIAVRTLMSLKRQHPSQANTKLRATKKTKPTSVLPNATEHSVVDGRKQPGPKQNALNVPTREVLYRPLSVNDLVTQRQEIQSASALVTRTLLSGSYPSPYQASGSLDEEEASALHATHRSAVCASLEKFTNDIIIPSFVGELHNTLVPEEATNDDASTLLYTKEHRTLDAKAKDTRHNHVLRAFYGTLLLLREVLVQNFDTVFGPHAASGLLLEAPMAASVEEEDSEIESLAKQIFVTAIILTGITVFFGSDGDNDSRDQSEQLIQAFFKCIEKYDRGHEEFADCLPLVDDRTVAVFPNLQPMNPVERVAWQLSCNFQRSLHPLYHHHHRLEHDLLRPRNGEDAPIDEGRQRRVLRHVPTPTAVHISILKIQSKSSTADARV